MAGLRLVLDDTSDRAACHECGVDLRDLHKNAKRVGLVLMHLKAWRDSWGDRLAPAWGHHLN